MVQTTSSPSRRLLLLLSTLALAGCGAEVAGNAAVIGKLQADQAAQAGATQAKIVDGLNAAQLAGAARAASAVD